MASDVAGRKGGDRLGPDCGGLRDAGRLTPLAEASPIASGGPRWSTPPGAPDSMPSWAVVCPSSRSRALPARRAPASSRRASRHGIGRARAGHRR